MTVVTVAMPPLPRYNDLERNDGKGSSEPNEKTRNVLDATLSIENCGKSSSGGFGQRAGDGIPSGNKGCSFKEFDEHLSLRLMGT